MVSITDDRGPGFLACSGILVFLALIVVGIRIYCRGTIRTHSGLKTGLGSDDYTMLIAMAFALFGFVCNVYEVRNGKGRHSTTLSRKQVSEAVKFGQLAQMQVLVGLYFAKLSIACLMLRVAKRAMHMRFIVWVTYITTALLTAVSIIVFVIWVIQCIPLEDIWLRPGKGRKCLDRHFVVHIVYLQSAVSLFTDLIFAVCPIYFTKNLQIAMSKKIALNVLMGLSLLTSAAGALKIVYLPDIEDTKDYTWDGINVSICALIEETMAITLGSLPTIAPLFERARKQVTSRFTSSTNGGGSTLRSWPAVGKRRTDTMGSMNDDVPLSGISVENTITIKSGGKMDHHQKADHGF